MYSVLNTRKGKLVLKLPECKRIFVSKGKRIHFSPDGFAVLPMNSKVSVCKINHREMHNIRMAKNKQMLFHNATIQKNNLTGGNIELIEEEILMASLEIIEVI